MSAPQAAAADGPARVLVLGGGGREHAIAWSLARESSIAAVLAAPGNDAIADEAKVRCFPQIAATDAESVLELATVEKLKELLSGVFAVVVVPSRTL